MAATQNAIAARRRNEGLPQNDSSAARSTNPMHTSVTGRAVAVPRYPGWRRLLNAAPPKRAETATAKLRTTMTLLLRIVARLHEYVRGVINSCAPAQPLAHARRSVPWPSRNREGAVAYSIPSLTFRSVHTKSPSPDAPGRSLSFAGRFRAATEYQNRQALSFQ
jgi:hypothetical protein